MSTFLQFLILGIGAGGAYALLALGVALIYRGSGVVNFSQGAIALVGVVLFYGLRGPLGTPLSIIGAILGCALLGVLIQVAVMRPMRHASSLLRVVATLGILTAITEAMTIKFGTDSAVFVQSFFPSSAIHITKTIVIGTDVVVIFIVTVLLTIGLWAFYKKTRFGIATAAVAENELATASLGWSPNLVAIGNWALGGALAGIAGVILGPIVGIAPESLSLVIVPALGATLIGGFSSFPLTLAGGLLIGILESEASRYVSQPGWNDAVPFLVIIAVLVIRGKALPLRGHLSDRLPRIGAGSLSFGAIAVGLVVMVVSLAVFTPSWSAAVTTGAVYGLISLSLIVIVGYCGQLSLAQFALAGVGALISARLADAGHMTFLLAFLIGLVATVPIGVVVALPAVRVRGVNLAVVTLGLAVTITSVLLGNPNYTGGPLRGTIVPTPKLFGWSIGALPHPARYAGFSIFLFVVAAFAVRNVRRSATGRKLITVRNNERAAASIGVNVVGVKLYTFGLAAGLAAIGGMILAFEFPNVDFTQYDVLTSINVVLFSVIGSIGYVGGAVFNVTSSPGGPLQEAISHFFTPGNWYLLVGSVLLITVLLANPDGIAPQNAHQWNWIVSKILRRPPKDRSPQWELSALTDVPPDEVEPGTLEIRGLVVKFGSVVAVNGLDLKVSPGEVVGLIGPNGAGKTTLIDAATGFIRDYQGTVLLNGKSLDRLSPTQRTRAGLTRSFQSLELFEDLSVADNLRAASDERTPASYVTNLVRPGAAELVPSAAVAVREFSLDDVLNKLPAELPSAQRRLVAIARAVATRPSVLLLDEPAAGLDENSTAELARLIRRLATQWRMAILMIEHDVQMVLKTCDRVVVLDFGRHLVTGTPAEIRRNPAVIAAYLGRAAEDGSGVGATTSDTAGVDATANGAAVPSDAPSVS